MQQNVGLFTQNISVRNTVKTGNVKTKNVKIDIPKVVNGWQVKLDAKEMTVSISMILLQGMRHKLHTLDV